MSPSPWATELSQSHKRGDLWHKAVVGMSARRSKSLSRRRRRVSLYFVLPLSLPLRELRPRPSVRLSMWWEVDSARLINSRRVAPSPSLGSFWWGGQTRDKQELDCTGLNTRSWTTVQKEKRNFALFFKRYHQKHTTPISFYGSAVYICPTQAGQATQFSYPQEKPQQNQETGGAQSTGNLLINFLFFSRKCTWFGYTISFLLLLKPV